jgi:hypothetical protein
LAPKTATVTGCTLGFDGPFLNEAAEPVKSKMLCAQDVSSTKNPIWLESSSLAREIFPFHSVPNYFLLAVPFREKTYRDRHERS